MPLDISPFLVKTTAIMTAVIILVIVTANLVLKEKKVNRGTVEKFIVIVKNSIMWLIILEALLTVVEAIKFILDLYIKSK